MRTYLTKIQARAIITTDQVEGDRLAMRCRSIAQDLFNIRYVFGFGKKLPDGIMNIAHVVEMGTAGSHKTKAMPDSVVSLLPEALRTTSGPNPLARSSNQWLCAHKSLYQDLPEQGCVLNTFHLSGLTGFTAGLIGCLTGQGPVHLHHYRQATDLADHARACGADMVYTARSNEGHVCAALGPDWTGTVASVHKNTHFETPGHTAVPSTSTRLYDVTCLNEMAIMGQARKDGQSEPEGLPLSEADGRPALLKIFLKTKQSNSLPSGLSYKINGGELMMDGASAPTLPFADQGKDTLQTNTMSQPRHHGLELELMGNVNASEEQRVSPVGFSGDIATKAGHGITGEELDQLYKAALDIVDDAAYYISADDNSLGVAVVTQGGQPVTLETLKQALNENGVSPLYWPSNVFVTRTIPRNAGDSVARGQLLAETRESGISLRSLKTATA